MADDWYSHPVAARFCTAVCVLFGGYPWTDRVAVHFGEQVPVYGKFR